MSKSLADLRKEKDQPAKRATRIVKVCLDLELLADVQRLVAEKNDLLFDEQRTAEGDKPGRPRRQGEGRNPRIAQIDAELEPLYDRLRESEGEVLLRATDGGSWQRWKDDHPPRKDNEADDRLAFGLCNASDLLDDLSKYAVAWNGDEFGPGEWSWFSDKIAAADLAACVSEVVEMHEQRVNAPKSRSVSSEHLTSVTDSNSQSA